MVVAVVAVVAVVVVVADLVVAVVVLRAVCSSHQTVPCTRRHPARGIDKFSCCAVAMPQHLGQNISFAQQPPPNCAQGSTYF